MAISLVGSTFIGGSFGYGDLHEVDFSTGNWTGGTVQQGDVVVLIATCRGNGSAAFTINTAGYTVDTNNPIVSTSTFTTHHLVAHKVMGSTPDTSVSVTQWSSSSSYEGGIMVVVLRGVAGSVLSATPTVATGINGNVVDNTSITPVATNALILVTATSVSDSSNFTYTAPPTGYTEIRQTSFANGSASSRNPLACAYKQWTSGAENPSAWTSSGSETSCSWAGVTIAFSGTYDYTETQTDTIALAEAPTYGLGVTQTDTISVDDSNTNSKGIIHNEQKNISNWTNQDKSND